MKTERKIEELLKLDGYKWSATQKTRRADFILLDDGKWVAVPLYLSSRDAIIPLVEKWAIANNWEKIFKVFCKVTSTDTGARSVFIMLWTMVTTSEQWCEILLRATNKWEDS